MPHFFWVRFRILWMLLLLAFASFDAAFAYTQAQCNTMYSNAKKENWTDSQIAKWAKNNGVTASQLRIAASKYVPPADMPAVGVPKNIAQPSSSGVKCDRYLTVASKLGGAMEISPVFKSDESGETAEWAAFLKGGTDMLFRWSHGNKEGNGTITYSATLQCVNGKIVPATRENRQEREKLISEFIRCFGDSSLSTGLTSCVSGRNKLGYQAGYTPRAEKATNLSWYDENLNFKVSYLAAPNQKTHYYGTDAQGGNPEFTPLSSSPVKTFDLDLKPIDYVGADGFRMKSEPCEKTKDQICLALYSPSGEKFLGRTPREISNAVDESLNSLWLNFYGPSYALLEIDPNSDLIRNSQNYRWPTGFEGLKIKYPAALFDSLPQEEKDWIKEIRSMQRKTLIKYAGFDAVAQWNGKPPLKYEADRKKFVAENLEVSKDYPHYNFYTESDFYHSDLRLFYPSYFRAGTFVDKPYATQTRWGLKDVPETIASGYLKKDQSGVSAEAGANSPASIESPGSSATSPSQSAKSANSVSSESIKSPSGSETASNDPVAMPAYETPLPPQDTTNANPYASKFTASQLATFAKFLVAMEAKADAQTQLSKADFYKALNTKLSAFEQNPNLQANPMAMNLIGYLKFEFSKFTAPSFEDLLKSLGG